MDHFSERDWGMYASNYDALLHLKPYRDMLGEVADAMGIFRSPLILDASCGTGNLELLCKERGILGASRMIGIDMTEAMIRRARTKLASVSDQCTFLNGDLNKKLPFQDKTVSAVVSINTLYAVNNPTLTLREFNRVLRLGGYLFLVTPQSGYENGLILKRHCGSTKPDTYWADLQELIREAVHDEAIIEQLLEVARFNREIRSESTFHFFTHDEIVTLLEETGFDIIHHSMTYADQDHFIIARKGA